MKLDIGRDSRMPSISPPITLPTTRPREASGAKCAASGTRICTDTDAKPTSSDTRRKTPGSRTIVAMPRLTADSSVVTISRRRFSTRSASGTMKKRPIA